MQSHGFASGPSLARQLRTMQPFGSVRSSRCRRCVSRGQQLAAFTQHNVGSNMKQEVITFVDEEGKEIKVMSEDYGFRSGHGRLYQGEEGKIPKSGWQLGLETFMHEYTSLRRTFVYDEWQEFEANSPSEKRPLVKLARGFGAVVVGQFAKIDRWLVDQGVLKDLPPSETDLQLADDVKANMDKELREKLSRLVLDVKAVDAREKRREVMGRGVKTPWFVKGPYIILCACLDIFYPNRPIQRFWLLEMVARMPYFSYLSMLHLYETLGWWRAGAELRKVHFAEEWNEMHHLQIMESLGGDELWFDRFLAQHASIVYYWILLVFFFLDPQNAYNFSELLEAHAVDTYGEFCDANKELLRTMPPPLAALKYYRGNDMYM